MGKNKSRAGNGGKRRGTRSRKGSGHVWIYGLHTVSAALVNPRRTVARLLATAEAVEKLPPAEALSRVEIVDRRALDQILPPGAVHQGVALAAEPLDQPLLDELIADAPEHCVVVVLDQVSDPHNVGAVLRGAAALGGLAVIQAERGAPGTTGVLAKAASGALEVVPFIAVTNLVRGLEALKSGGFWCIGLDGGAEKTLAETAPTGRVALVLGAEGSGLRRLTAEHCDLLARLPTRPPVASLNVSAAAAVALYELARK